MSNKIYAIAGPYASGKSTIIAQLISMGIHYIPTYTTKPKRRSDNNQNIYRFVDKDEFAQMNFIVKATYKGDYYGVLKDDVLDALQTHRISTMLIDGTGIKQLSKLIQRKLHTIYIMVDYVALVERMLRMGHTNEDIKYHLEYAENNSEFDTWKVATYVVKNTGDPHVAMDQVLAIMGLMTFLPQDKFYEAING